MFEALDVAKSKFSVFSSMILYYMQKLLKKHIFRLRIPRLNNEMGVLNLIKTFTFFQVKSGQILHSDRLIAYHMKLLCGGSLGQ
jgi:hypothetical protein